jgi:hypothetical protein
MILLFGAVQSQLLRERLNKAQAVWFRHYATIRKVAGSISEDVIDFFYFI